MQRSRWIEAEEEIQIFKKEFLVKYGIRLGISYTTVNIKLPHVTLEDIYETCNEVLSLEFPTGVVTGSGKRAVITDGMLTKSRIRPLVIIRQLYAYFAREMGFGCTEAANYINMNHTTMIYSHKEIMNGLEVKEPSITKLHDKMHTRLIYKYGSYKENEGSNTSRSTEENSIA